MIGCQLAPASVVLRIVFSDRRVHGRRRERVDRERGTPAALDAEDTSRYARGVPARAGVGRLVDER